MIKFDHGERRELEEYLHGETEVEKGDGRGQRGQQDPGHLAMAPKRAEKTQTWDIGLLQWLGLYFSASPIKL